MSNRECWNIFNQNIIISRTPTQQDISCGNLAMKATAGRSPTQPDHVSPPLWLGNNLHVDLGLNACRQAVVVFRTWYSKVSCATELLFTLDNLSYSTRKRGLALTWGGGHLCWLPWPWAYPVLLQNYYFNSNLQGQICHNEKTSHATVDVV